MTAAFFVCLCIGASFCPSSGWGYEFAFGVGSNISNEMHTAQVLIAPCRVWEIAHHPSVSFKFAGELEIIAYQGEITVVGGFVPMLRWYTFSQRGEGLFFEGGIGANLISRQRVRDRNLGGTFIFSDSVGIGYTFRLLERPVSMSFRYRHLSNAGIYKENDGLDALYLIFSFPWH